LPGVNSSDSRTRVGVPSALAPGSRSPLALPTPGVSQRLQGSEHVSESQLPAKVGSPLLRAVTFTADI